MGKQYHYLKTETEYYQLHHEGVKTFEVRKKVILRHYIPKILKHLPNGDIHNNKVQLKNVGRKTATN